MLVCHGLQEVLEAPACKVAVTVSMLGLVAASRV